MSRYRIDRSDLAVAREFLADPVGYHSPGLQRVLNLMRGSGVAPRPWITSTTLFCSSALITLARTASTTGAGVPAGA